jgi:hypothetical protein
MIESSKVKEEKLDTTIKENFGEELSRKRHDKEKTYEIEKNAA